MSRTIPYILLPKKNYGTRRHSKLNGDLFNGGHLRKQIFHAPSLKFLQNFFLSSLWRKFLFSEKFFAKTFKRGFSFSLQKFSFLFLSSLLYMFSTLARQSNNQRLFGANFCGFSVSAFHFSNQQERSFTGKGAILTVFKG